MLILNSISYGFASGCHTRSCRATYRRYMHALGEQSLLVRVDKYEFDVRKQHTSK